MKLCKDSPDKHSTFAASGQTAVSSRLFLPCTILYCHIKGHDTSAVIPPTHRALLRFGTLAFS